MRTLSFERGESFSSPSSRRAWIEILARTTSAARCSVALLAEGVDRNIAEMSCNVTRSRSPSSRRAWIEILDGLLKA